jgi:hypothetical protein
VAGVQCSNVSFGNQKEKGIDMAKFLQSKDKPTNWFKVVGYDKETQMATLRGPTGIEFKEKITTSWLDRLGYQLITSESNPA